MGTLANKSKKLSLKVPFVSEYKKTFFCNVLDVNLIENPSLFCFISISIG